MHTKLSKKTNKVSVRKAAALYNVPETTLLRDRILGIVHPKTVKSGTAPIFAQIEEARLVEHFKYMAKYGYGYCRQECVDIATDLAAQLGKRTNDKPLTIKWFRGFIKRWPELKVLKPRALELVRAKMASADSVNSYFKNLKSTTDKHGLSDKPHLIFNCDEKGISVDHKHPHIVASSRYCPLSFTSGKGQTTTLIGCVSASGVALPPFLIFPGKRFSPDLMTGALAGAQETVSESGWSNGIIFREYLETHFLQHVPRPPGQKVLLILDGHKSHVSVGLTEWAERNGIIIFILPSHTSHKSIECKLRHVKSENSGKTRQTMGKLVAGKELDKETVELMVEHESKQKKVVQRSMKRKEKSVKLSETQPKKPCCKPTKSTTSEPQQCPSHMRLDVDSDSSINDMTDEELCCVCNKQTPDKAKHSISIVFIEWAQCDGCRNGHPCLHWAHLGYCTAVRVIRRGDKFLCPHCIEE